MAEMQKGGIPDDENFFICTSEKEIELVGTLDIKGAPHTSEQIPEIIAEAVNEAIQKEVGTAWQNEPIQQAYLYRP